MLVSAASVFSQAEKIKEAKKLAGGETPDFAKAISTINEALQNPGTANDVEAWYTKGLIYSKQFDFEDDKRFQVPPQTPDVNIQSEAAYNAYKTWLIADSLDVIESQNNPKRKGKLKYHNDIVKKVYANKDYLNNYGAILTIPCSSMQETITNSPLETYIMTCFLMVTQRRLRRLPLMLTKSIQKTQHS